MDTSVGTTLREARERRGIDLAQVAASTKIRGRFLGAIEAEEWEILPPEVYARSFIRTYAEYLGLDGRALVERHRRATAPPDEEEAGSDLVPKPLQRPAWRPRLEPRLTAVLVSLLLVGVLVAVGLSTDQADFPGSPGPDLPAAVQGAEAVGPARALGADTGLSLELKATGEIWVCVVGADGEPVVDGEVLAAGAEAGPFRSDSFLVSLGNGEVSMRVNRHEARIPATPSPVGYSIGAGGGVRELHEDERPTCT